VGAKSCFLGWLRDVCTYALDGPGSIPIERLMGIHDLVLLSDL